MPQPDTQQPAAAGSLSRQPSKARSSPKSYSQVHALKSSISSPAAGKPPLPPAPQLSTGASERKPCVASRSVSPAKSPGYSARVKVHVHAQACGELADPARMAADHARLLAIMQADDLPPPSAHGAAIVAARAAPELPPAKLSTVGLAFAPATMGPCAASPPACDAKAASDRSTVAPVPGSTAPSTDADMTSTVQMLNQLLHASTDGPIASLAPAGMATAFHDADGVMQRSVRSMLDGAQPSRVTAQFECTATASTGQLMQLPASKSAAALTRMATHGGEVSEDSLLASAVHVQRRLNRNAQTFAARATARARACSSDQRKHQGSATATGQSKPGELTFSSSQPACDGSQVEASSHTLTTIIAAQLTQQAADTSSGGATGRMTPSRTAPPTSQTTTPAAMLHASTTTSIAPAAAPFENAPLASPLFAGPYQADAGTQVAARAAHAVPPHGNGSGGGSAVRPVVMARRRRTRTRKERVPWWSILACGMLSGCTRTLSPSSSRASSVDLGPATPGSPAAASPQVPVGSCPHGVPAPAEQAGPGPALQPAAGLDPASCVRSGSKVEAAMPLASLQTAPEVAVTSASGTKPLCSTHTGEHEDAVILHSPRISAVCEAAATPAAGSGGPAADAQACSEAAAAAHSSGLLTGQLPSLGELEGMQLGPLLSALQGVLLSPRALAAAQGAPAGVARYGPNTPASAASQSSRNNTAGGRAPSTGGRAAAHVRGKAGSVGRRRRMSREVVLTGALRVTQEGAVTKPTSQLVAGVGSSTAGAKLPRAAPTRSHSNQHVVDGKAFMLPAYLVRSPRLCAYQPPWERTPDSASWCAAAAGSANVPNSASPRAHAAAASSLVQAALMKREARSAAALVNGGSTWRPGGSPSPRGTWWELNAESSPMRTAANTGMRTSVASSVTSAGVGAVMRAAAAAAAAMCRGHAAISSPSPAGTYRAVPAVAAAADALLPACSTAAEPLPAVQAGSAPTCENPVGEMPGIAALAGVETAAAVVTCISLQDLMAMPEAAGAANAAGKEHQEVACSPCDTSLRKTSSSSSHAQVASLFQEKLDEGPVATCNASASASDSPAVCGSVAPEPEVRLPSINHLMLGTHSTCSKSSEGMVEDAAAPGTCSGASKPPHDALEATAGTEQATGNSFSIMRFIKRLGSSAPAPAAAATAPCTPAGGTAFSPAAAELALKASQGSEDTASSGPADASTAAIVAAVGNGTPGSLPTRDSLRCDDLDVADLPKPELEGRTSLGVSHAGLAPPHDPHWMASRSGSFIAAAAPASGGADQLHPSAGTASMQQQCKLQVGPACASLTLSVQARVSRTLASGTPNGAASPLRTTSRASSSQALKAALDPLQAPGIPSDAKEQWTPAALRQYETTLTNVETILAQQEQRWA